MAAITENIYKLIANFLINIQINHSYSSKS